jgi:hypothetical protein
MTDLFIYFDQVLSWFLSIAVHSHNEINVIHAMVVQTKVHVCNIFVLITCGKLPVSEMFEENLF